MKPTYVWTVLPCAIPPNIQVHICIFLLPAPGHRSLRVQVRACVCVRRLLRMR